MCSTYTYSGAALTNAGPSASPTADAIVARLLFTTVGFFPLLGMLRITSNITRTHSKEALCLK